MAGGNQHYDVAYPQSYVQSTVTDPLGTSRTYHFQTILGVVKSTGITQPNGAGGSASTSIAYDANANVASSTDFNGVTTTYSYDLTRNLETSRVEASGTAQARTISTQWHPTYRIPVKIAEPLKLATFTHDAKGNVLTRTEQPTTDASGAQGFSAAVTGIPRTWTYTYDAIGQMLTMNGPRTDIADTTGHAYDTQGNLISITNAKGHPTLLSNYDAHGRVGKIIDPNGVITELSYSPRGWLTQQKITDGSLVKTTDFTYDNAGQLTQVTLPGAINLSLQYDPAHRLTGIADNFGNSVIYTLDAMGNRTNEQMKDPSGALSRQVSRMFDALNRLQQVTGGVQ